MGTPSNLYSYLLVLILSLGLALQILSLRTRNYWDRLRRATNVVPDYPDTLQANALQVDAEQRPSYAAVSSHLLIDSLQENSYPAYRRASVLERGAPKRMCRETCCVELVAISLDQDAQKIINTMDSQDLADVLISFDWDYYQPHLKYHAQNFHEEMIPCLLPGTIFQIDNQYKNLDYFWEMVRPRIKVPYIIMTSTSDRDSPLTHFDRMSDPLLLKWYGTNPVNRPDEIFEARKDKLRPLPLGLSYQHPQEKHLLPYLEQTNFSNPFLDKTKWDFTRRDGFRNSFEFDRDVFVHFGLRRQHRIDLWANLCPNTTKSANHTSASCNSETSKLPVRQIYKDMSQFKYVVSPPGLGWDCYRTYEALLLGVIPIITERAPWSHIMFEGLPVIQMGKLDGTTTKRRIRKAIRDYIKSDAFQKVSFEEGWNKLFLQHTRTQLLKDAGRHGDIFRGTDGKEYYQGFRYSVRQSGVNPDGATSKPADVLCKNEGSCEVDTTIKREDLRTNPMPKPSDKKHFDWLAKWEEKRVWNIIETG